LRELETDPFGTIWVTSQMHKKISSGRNAKKPWSKAKRTGQGGGADEHVLGGVKRSFKEPETKKPLWTVAAGQGMGDKVTSVRVKKRR